MVYGFVDLHMGLKNEWMGLGLDDGYNGYVIGNWILDQKDGRGSEIG